MFEADRTPSDLRPRFAGATVSEPAIYRSLYIVDTIDGYQSNIRSDRASRPADADDAPTAEDQPIDLPQPTAAEVTGPMDPFSADLEEVQSEPAIGVLLVHKQAWEQKGLALGNLLHSVCLAPGEVTQVAVTNWERRSAGTSTEDTTQGETVTSDIEQTRSVNEVQNAVAQETQAGNSATSANSTTAESGASFGSLMWGASASAANTSTSALTAQFSTGSRALEAESSNALNQSTAEKSQALRSRRASVVREVTEAEKEETSVRVLVNYNRRHSLNIEYFEILQLYDISTKLLDWQRCIFLPLKPIRFETFTEVNTYLPQIADVFGDFGMEEMFKKLIDYRKTFLGDGAGDTTTHIDLEKAYRGAQSKFEDAKRRVSEAAERRDTCQEAMQLLQEIQGATSRENVEEELACYRELQLRVILPDSVDTWGTSEGAENVGAARKTVSEKLDVYRTELSAAQTERRDAEAEMTKADKATENMPLREFFRQEYLWLSQQIWLRLDPYRVYQMLKGRTLMGRRLEMLIDPHPVGVFGNYVAFRWGFAQKDAKERELFHTSYLGGNITPSSVGDQPDAPDKLTIALPSTGVFAEAILGSSEAAEEIDESRFWRWNEEPIPILPPKIKPVASRDRAKGLDLASGQFASALATLRAQDPRDISHIGSVIGQIGNGDMFRNMGGLAEAAALAQRAAELSGEGANEAGRRAAEIQAKVGETMVQMVEQVGKLMDSDMGQAIVAEAMLPGAGPELLGVAKKLTGGGAGSGGGDGPKKATGEDSLSRDTPTAESGSEE